MNDRKLYVITNLATMDEFHTKFKYRAEEKIKENAENKQGSLVTVFEKQTQKVVRHEQASNFTF